ncbi:MAG: holo-ACP synthase [Alphaproteobacteria bacterium]|nr:holo-ACP synthase [Alphaproteobacteria bacterium]
MIIGIGSDLTNIDRIDTTLKRFGNRFVQRVFTPVEQAKAAKRVRKAETYAKRFAAKEACCKALGTGFYRGVFFRDIGVVNLRSGQPTLALSGGALERLQELTPPGMTVKIHLTLTDDSPWAQAFVVIEALEPIVISR